MTKTNTTDPVEAALRELSEPASPGERWITSRAWRDYQPGGGTRPRAKPVVVRTAEELSTRSVTTPDALKDHDDIGDTLTEARPRRLLDAMNTIPVDSLAGVVQREETSHSGDADVQTFASTPGGTSTFAEFSGTFDVQRVDWTRTALFAAISEDAGDSDPAVRDIIDELAGRETEQKLEDLALNADSSNAGVKFDGMVTAAGTTVTRDDANGESRHDAIRRAVTTLHTEADGEPLTLVVSPQDAEDIDTEKDSNGDYLKGSGILDDVDRRVVTPQLAAGTAVLTALPRHRLWVKRPGVSVKFSTSHDDWFARGWTALAAFGRVVLQVDADATVEVTL